MTRHTRWMIVLAGLVWALPAFAQDTPTPTAVPATSTPTSTPTNTPTFGPTLASDTYRLINYDISALGGPGDVTVPFTFAISTSATPSRKLETAGKRVYLAKIPAGATLLGFVLDVPALDSSTGVTLSVGDATDQFKFVALSTLGRSNAGGKIICPMSLATPATTLCINSTLPVRYAAANAVVVTVSNAPSGTAATTGTLNGWIRYTPLRAD